MNRTEIIREKIIIITQEFNHWAWTLKLASYMDRSNHILITQK